MPGMFTSSRISAKSRCSNCRRASRPEPAEITSTGMSSSSVSIDSSFSGRSSTSSTLALRSICIRNHSNNADSGNLPA
jgi:hypothetical protein